MNREVLDRLLADRALGALEPDVCELLNAWLDHDADADKRAREFSLATDLASRALGTVADETPLPPFPATLLAHAERSQRRLRIITRAASLAACLLLGITVGAWAVRPPVAADGSSAGASSADGSSAGASSAGGPAVVRGASAGGTATAARPPCFVQATPRAEQGFWSVRRYCEQAQKAGPARPPHVEWFSPVREPRIGGAS
jgi:hypothetical protein